LLWDSLAICEHLAERFPEAHLWPKDLPARAHARSVSAEMHAGFADLRTEMPMNIVRRTPKEPSPAVAADVARILAIWNECRERYKDAGPFLFGAFSIADAMYAPVVTRFMTYDVKVDSTAHAYMDTIVALPGMQQWTRDAAEEVRAGLS